MPCCPQGQRIACIYLISPYKATTTTVCSTLVLPVLSSVPLYHGFTPLEEHGAVCQPVFVGEHVKLRAETHTSACSSARLCKCFQEEAESGAETLHAHQQRAVDINGNRLYTYDDPYIV